jgi:hypothetical protein
MRRRPLGRALLVPVAPESVEKLHKDATEPDSAATAAFGSITAPDSVPLDGPVLYRGSWLFPTADTTGAMQRLGGIAAAPTSATLYPRVFSLVTVRAAGEGEAATIVLQLQNPGTGESGSRAVAAAEARSLLLAERACLRAAMHVRTEASGSGAGSVAPKKRKPVKGGTAWPAHPQSSAAEKEVAKWVATNGQKEPKRNRVIEWLLSRVRLVRVCDDEEPGTSSKKRRPKAKAKAKGKLLVSLEPVRGALVTDLMHKLPRPLLDGGGNVPLPSMERLCTSLFGFEGTVAAAADEPQTVSPPPAPTLTVA